MLYIEKTLAVWSLTKQTLIIVLLYRSFTTLQNHAEWIYNDSIAFKWNYNANYNFIISIVLGIIKMCSWHEGKLKIVNNN